MPYVDWYINEFGGANNELEHWPSGGDISYSGGNLVLTSYGGVDNRWSGAAQNPVIAAFRRSSLSAPAPYAALAQPLQYGVIYAEARLSSYTFAGGDDTPGIGLALYSDSNNAFKVMYRPDDTLSYVQLQKHVSGTQSEVSRNESVTDPNTTPMRFRLYLNPRGYDMGTNLGDVMGEYSYYAYFSDDDGVTWQNIGSGAGTENMDLTRVSFGLYLMRSTDTTTEDLVANFDYLRVYAQIPDNFPKFFSQIQPDFEAGYEDRVTYPQMTGPVKQGDTIEGRSVGQRVPGPADTAVAEYQAATSNTKVGGPHDAAGYEDDHTLPTAGGPPKYGDARGLDQGVGVRVPGPAEHPVAETQTLRSATRIGGPHDQAACEDGLFYDLGANADYMEGVNDADGREFLNAYDCYRCFRHITLDEQWHTPVAGDGFYGASKEGKWHYDGEVCLPGPLSTAAGGIIGKHWSPHRDGAWSQYNSQSYIVTYPADGEVKMDSIGTVSGGHGCTFESWGRWVLTGDFDIMVEFKDFASNTSGSGGFYLDIYHDGRNRTYVQRDGTTYSSNSQNNDTWSSEVSVATSDTEGKLRITRTGTSIRTYRWVGSDWTQLGGPWTWSAGAVPVFVRLGMWLNDRAAEAIAFGFNVTSGEYSNYAGWARETPNSHRGSRVDFPTESAIIATANSLEIIDTENDKLWMRFTEGSNDIIANWGSSSKPWTIRFKEGILLVAGYTGGGGHYIDFTTDTAITLRTEASTMTGARYRGHSGVASNVDGSMGFKTGNGTLQQRNNGRGYGGDYNQWQLPSVNVSYMDFEIDNGYVYFVTACTGGMGVHKWRRWWFSDATNRESISYPDYAWSEETGSMQWGYFIPGTMDLLYSDADYLYSIGNTALENALIGFPDREWSYAHRLALPTPISKQSQRHPFYYNSSIFHCTDYGIYQIPWPGGPAVMLYSKVGFGGTHTILPNFYTRINAIAFAKDGTNDLLLADLYDEVRELAQVVAINLTTHTLYAKTKIVRGGKVAGGLDG